jgi:hypothetical protein
MKIPAFLIFFCFSLFTASGIYAANNALVSDYPSPSGSYNRMVLSPPASTTTPYSCSGPNDKGQLYYDSALKNLRLCAYINGSYQTVNSNAVESCFTRFCSVNALTTTSCFAASPCPAGYTQAKNSGTPIAPYFQNTTNGSYTVFTTACCGSSSTVLPT